MKIFTWKRQTHYLTLSEVTILAGKEQYGFIHDAFVFPQGKFNGKILKMAPGYGRHRGKMMVADPVKKIILAEIISIRKTWLYRKKLLLRVLPDRIYTTTYCSYGTEFYLNDKMVASVEDESFLSAKEGIIKIAEDCEHAEILMTCMFYIWYVYRKENRDSRRSYLDLFD